MTKRSKKKTGLPDSGQLSRRSLPGILAGLGAGLGATVAACSSATTELECQGYLLPPPNATVKTTACAYCIVGCGYKSYSWPISDPSGGESANENAFGVDFPVAPLSGYWITPQMYNIVTINNELHHIVVVPDAEADVVNLGGDHNLGASLAQRFYNENGNTKDRLLKPQLRVGGELFSISWEHAIVILGEVTKHVLATRGPLAWAMKTYSYQFYENTYAITKFAFDGIKTPCWASHDQPADGPSTPGLSDSGINAFSASYEDWGSSNVIFVSGVGLYEQRAVLFSQWIAGGPKLVVVNPVEDETALYAQENGGLFLQIKPGTDTLLHHAMARIIIEEGWEDSEFISAHIVDDEQLTAEQAGNSRRTRFGVTYQTYRDFILNNDLHRPENAAAITNISADLIRAAARMLAEPNSDGSRVKTSLMLEKGNYWSHNYANSASFSSLGLLVGAGNRPGQVISRGGGHQRGMVKGAGYPIEISPEERNGEKVPINLDAHLLRGNLSLAWVIGCTWIGGGSAHTNALFEQVRQQARGSEYPQVGASQAFPNGTSGALDVQSVIATLKAKIDVGGMVFVQQDIYTQAMSELTDLILPALSWGEAPFARMQGERRLRHYAQLVDPPGESKADWRVISELAAYLGYSGFDWADENAIFEEAAARTAGKANDYVELVKRAKELGMTGHEYLASMGTTGIQCPIQREGDALVGTIRLHDEELGKGFSTMTGKALFVIADYEELVVSRDPVLAPSVGELQIINRRIGSSWSSLVEDQHNPFRAVQMPENLFEMHPVDAAEMGIEDGDEVFVSTGNLMDEAIEPANPSAAGGFRARVTIIETMLPGVACSYFNFRGEPAMSANAVVPNSPDPVSGLFSLKLGRGRVTKVS